jgi:hypothetical protein
VTIHPLPDKRPVTTSLVWRKGEASLPLKALQAELTSSRKSKVERRK